MDMPPIDRTQTVLHAALCGGDFGFNLSRDCRVHLSDPVSYLYKMDWAIILDGYSRL